MDIPATFAEPASDWEAAADLRDQRAGGTEGACLFRFRSAALGIEAPFLLHAVGLGLEAEAESGGRVGRFTALRCRRAFGLAALDGAVARIRDAGDDVAISAFRLSKGYLFENDLLARIRLPAGGAFVGTWRFVRNAEA
ncbi:MAG: hypothetical protein AAFV49_17825 [Pseudomonadota bacterium]